MARLLTGCPLPPSICSTSLVFCTCWLFFVLLFHLFSLFSVVCYFICLFMCVCVSVLSRLLELLPVSSVSTCLILESVILLVYLPHLLCSHLSIYLSSIIKFTCSFASPVSLSIIPFTILTCVSIYLSIKSFSQVRRDPTKHFVVIIILARSYLILLPKQVMSETQGKGIRSLMSLIQR